MTTQYLVCDAHHEFSEICGRYPEGMTVEDGQRLGMFILNHQGCLLRHSTEHEMLDRAMEGRDPDDAEPFWLEWGTATNPHHQHKDGLHRSNDGWSLEDWSAWQRLSNGEKAAHLADGTLPNHFGKIL